MSLFQLSQGHGSVPEHPERHQQPLHEQPDSATALQGKEEAAEQGQHPKLQPPTGCRWTLCGGELRCHPPCCFRSQHQRCLASLGFCLPRSAQWAPSQGDLLQILPHLELNLDKKG